MLARLTRLEQQVAAVQTQASFETTAAARVVPRTPPMTHFADLSPEARTSEAHTITQRSARHRRSLTSRQHLRLGTLLRGLSKVAEHAEYKYTDRNGRRRNGVEYAVPRRRRA
jgi:hypothetical protein